MLKIDKSVIPNSGNVPYRIIEMLVLDVVVRGFGPILHVVQPPDNKYSLVLENNNESDITKVTKELQQQTLEDPEKEDEAEDGACVSFSFTL